MYGAGFGQSLFYAYYFPDDRALVKSVVGITIVMDTIHVWGCSQLYWQLLVACRRNFSQDCQTRLPVSFSLAVFLNYCITFIVQCFYAQRVWIVSGRNKLITFLVVVPAVVGLGIGLVCSVKTFQYMTIQYIFTTPLIAYCAVVSTVCDIMITGSIVYFLRAGQSRVRL
ncbi:hypothetical protein HYDPIDRAFT_105780 [Hydnomerulius pinastri MD-312]|nr:hypothetical protein HYDPIDRAFT_105780 [Hydnomerulius pinastri MD-312]